MNLIVPEGKFVLGIQCYIQLLILQNTHQFNTTYHIKDSRNKIKVSTADIGISTSISEQRNTESE